MPTDHVQKFATKFKLPWREIYHLDAQFQSLVKIECQEIQKELDNLQQVLYGDGANKSARFQS